VWKEEKAA